MDSFVGRRNGFERRCDNAQVKLLVALAGIVLLIGACTDEADDAAAPPAISPSEALAQDAPPSPSTAAASPTPAPAAPTPDGATEVTTLTSVEWEFEGDAVTVCSAAVNEVASNDSDWQGRVLHDELVESGERVVRWLVCVGEGGSGRGSMVLRSEDSTTWSLTPVGGRLYHAGDQLDFVVFDPDRAALTWTSLITPLHIHAFTTDSGMTWTAILHNRWR